MGFPGDNGTFVFWPSSGGVTKVGTILGSGSGSVEGGVVIGNTLYLQYATESQPGIVSTSSQNFGGNKTFFGDILPDDVPLASFRQIGTSSQNLRWWRLHSIFANVNVVEPYIGDSSGLLITGGSSVSGSTTYDVQIGPQDTLGNGGTAGVLRVYTGSSSEIQVGDILTTLDTNGWTKWRHTGRATETISSCLIFTGWDKSVINSASIQVVRASVSTDGYLSSADFAAFQATVAAPITVGSFDSVNVNKSIQGAVIGSNQLFMQSATPLLPGIISSNNQSFAGVKTFFQRPVLSDSGTAPLLVSSSSVTTGSITLTSQVSGVLPLANGGTATSSQFSQGSVLFAGPNGIYAQDNANLFWDNTNDRLGVRTAAPQFPFHVIGSAGTIAKFQSGGGGGATVVFSSSTGQDVELGAQSGNCKLGTATNDAFDLRSNNAKRLQLDANGDIFFVGNTGSSTIVFWDRANARLGINKGVPLHPLDVGGTGAMATLRTDNAIIGSITHTSSTGATAYTVRWPGVQSSSTGTLTNDGLGNLYWGTSGGGISNTVGSGGYSLVATPGGAGTNEWRNLSSPSTAQSYALAAAVTSGNLRISVVQPDGSSGLSATNPAVISFRSSTLTSGRTNTRYVSGSLSITLNGGTPLNTFLTNGTLGSMVNNLYVYAWDVNDGTNNVNLFLSTSRCDENSPQSVCYADQAVTFTIGTSTQCGATVGGMKPNMSLSFTTLGSGSGALPSPLVLNNRYWVTSVGTTTFTISDTPGGSNINTSGSQLGTHTLRMQHTGLVSAQGVAAGEGALVRYLGAVNVAPATTTTGSWSSVVKISSSPSDLVGDEGSIYAKYNNSQTSINGSLQRVLYIGRDFDSHNAYSPDGVYIASQPGKYQVNAALIVGGTYVAAQATAAYILRNGNRTSQAFTYAGGAQGNATAIVSDIIQLDAFDRVTFGGSSDATTPTISQSSFSNYFSITRIGG